MKDKLGINSPSTVFQGFGENLMQGLALGMKNLSDQPQKMLDGITGNLSASMGGLSLATAGGGGSTVTNSRSTVNNFTLPSSVAGGAQDDDMLRVYRTLSALYAQ
jgi:hypothetical protein